MNEEQVQLKLDSMKKTRRTLKTVTTIVSILAIILLVVYNFVGVTFLQIPVKDLIISAANFEEGFPFPGWQMIFWGCGGQFIMQDNLFNPNPISIVGMVGTFLVLVICLATYKAGRNKAKAVKEFISGAFLLYSAVILGFCIVPVAKTAITNDGVYHFASYLEEPGTVFNPTTFAIIFGVVMLIFAIVKFANGAFLLYQKSFAQKYAAK